MLLSVVVVLLALVVVTLVVGAGAADLVVGVAVVAAVVVIVIVVRDAVRVCVLRLSSAFAALAGVGGVCPLIVVVCNVARGGLLLLVPMCPLGRLGGAAPTFAFAPASTPASAPVSVCVCVGVGARGCRNRNPHI